MNYHSPRTAAAAGNLNLLKLLLETLSTYSKQQLPELMKDNWLAMLRMTVNFQYKDIMLYLLPFFPEDAGLEACVLRIFYPFVVQQCNLFEEAKADDSRLMFDPKTLDGSQFYFYMLRHFLWANHAMLRGDSRFCSPDQNLDVYILNWIAMPTLQVLFTKPKEIEALVLNKQYLDAFDLLPSSFPIPETLRAPEDEAGVSTLTRPASFNWDESAVELTHISMFRSVESNHAHQALGQAAEEDAGHDGRRLYS